MSRRGENLPDFVARQLEFAAHIRNPTLNPAPVDVDPARMRVYVELFYNNIQSLLATTFPVAKSVLGPERWSALIRAFIHRHPSASPYFPDVSQEFLQFVAEQPADSLPGYLVELCHYEWVELGLGLADVDWPSGLDADGDPLVQPILRSPLAWSLSYAYPVHRIGPAHQPETPSEEPSHLVVYRDHADRVRFMEVNALTQRLLLMLDGERTGGAVLAALAAELPEAAARIVGSAGAELLGRLRSAGIVLCLQAEASGVSTQADTGSGPASPGEKGQ